MQNRLFQSLQIGSREARNRILFGSHTTNFAQHNLLSQEHADYYATRAAGGVGIVVLEEHIVHSSDLPYENALLGYLPGTPAALASVTERIHAHSSLALVQLNHNGQQSTSDHHQRELWAPSAVANVGSREVPKVMELEDISAVIEGFALVTRHAVQGNADGVELQVADSSLLRQFLSPLTNSRNDQYGGALENRLRFLQETIEAVDGALGSDRVLGVRLCADELAPWAGLTPEQSLEIAQLLTESGRIDYMTVTIGSIFSSQMFPFHASMHTGPGYATHLAAALKAAIKVPVFAAGRIMNATQAERILAEEQADGVEMIRALIADPHLPRLFQAGREKEIRPCIACNQGCQVRNVMNAALGCNVNPDVVGVQGRYLGIPEHGRRVPTRGTPTMDGPRLGRDTSGSYGGTQSTLHIIGGGPAGMEAARTAALRGRHVVLYERETTLGGAVALAAKGSGRGELQLIIDYLQRQLEQLNVEIQLGVEMTAESILAQHPESVLVATGARMGCGLLPIPGHDLPHVIDVRRILAGGHGVFAPMDGPHLGHDPGPRVPTRGTPTMDGGLRVVIIDETDSHAVLSVAELLAMEGYTVEIVSEDWYIGHDLTATHDIVSWMQRTMALNVVMTPHTSIVRIEPGQVVVADRFAPGTRSLPADMVVLGVYEQPAQELYYALKGRVPQLFRAGDCVAPRRIAQAISEGRHIGEM